MLTSNFGPRLDYRVIRSAKDPVLKSKQRNVFGLLWLLLVVIWTCGCGMTSGPAIDSLSPERVPAGTSNFLLNVSGAGFSPGSIVLLNGRARTTTFVNESQLSVLILASDVAEPKKLMLQVSVLTPVPAKTNLVPLAVQSATDFGSSTLHITTNALPAGAVGVGYDTALDANNGVPPYSWSVVGGQLPPGLGLQASTGQIAGTPSQAGTFSLSVQAKDSSNATAAANFSVNIGAASTPVVNGISPSSGPTSGGTTVTISGANFSAGATITFGGSAATSVVVSSPSQIQAVTPAHIAGTVGVIVELNGQSSSSNASFTYNTLTPTVSSISPNNGPTAGGTKVTITGTNFLAGALVLFGTASASSVIVNSPTQIQAVTPPNAAGITNVTIQDPGNLSGALSSGFTYTSSSNGTPTITSISPTSGTPGTKVTITGTNFTAADTVAFGTTNATPTAFLGPTQLSATVPTLSAGTYSVTVTDPDPASTTLTNGFTVVTPPAGQSLLSGCTVNASNQPNCSIPSGWSLVIAEGFENGSLGSTEAMDQNNSIVTNNPHTGSHSMKGHYGGDGDRVSWFLAAGNTGSFNELWISYWDYADPNAMYGNSDYFLVDINNPAGCGGQGQDFGYDAQDFTGNLTPLSTSTIIGVSQGSTSSPSTCQGYYQYSTGSNLAMNAGSWRQVEIHFKPSTTVSTGSNCNDSNGGTYCNGDGEAELYINGQLQQRQLNANLNGSQSMAGTGIELGGTLTDFCDQGGTRAVPFSKCQANAPTPFNRYIDDIVVLKK